MEYAISVSFADVVTPPVVEGAIHKRKIRITTSRNLAHSRSHLDATSRSSPFPNTTDLFLARDSVIGVVLSWIIIQW